MYPGEQLSKPDRKHPKYPYLLRGKTIWMPNQVWASEMNPNEPEKHGGPLYPGPQAKTGANVRGL